MTASDVDLLTATRNGDGPAFGMFYRRRRGLALAFLSRRANSPEIVADLLAETFAAALAAVLDEQRELPRDPVAWLLTIAHNKLVDGLRRGKVEAVARERLEMQPLKLDDGDLAEIEEASAETNLLESLTELLSAEQLEALKARVLEERDYAEIAESMLCSEAVIRKRVSRALRVLRHEMEGSR